MNKDDIIPFTIIACCVLHNICLDGIDAIDDFIAEGYNEAPSDEICEEIIENDANGEVKRNYLVTLVSQSFITNQIEDKLK